MAAYLCSMIVIDSINRATKKDIDALVTLVNNAYRGEKSRQGWTHEADLINGDLRTDAHDLEKLIEDPGAVILTHTENDHITGCVYLQKQMGALYLGMLSVDPMQQAKGIGKKLLAAADSYAHQTGCKQIVMTVISKRNELVQWYQRHGYHDTGIRKPFHTEARFGTPNEPVEFMVLSKPVNL